MYTASLSRYARSSDTQKQPQSRNYRNVTRGDEDDDGDEDLQKNERERKRIESLGEGDGREAWPKQLFRLVSPGTIQNSVSNSKAVRQSATSLFARKSSRFFKGRANRFLNPNERLRVRKREKTRKEFAERERTTPKGIFNWASNRAEFLMPKADSQERKKEKIGQAFVITKMSNIYAFIIILS